MTSLNIEKFKAKLEGGGARPNLFKVLVNFPNYAGGDTELTSFMCEAASIPGSQIGEILHPWRGRQIPIAGDRTFEPWEITVTNDTNFDVHDAFVNWMNGINGLESNLGFTRPADYEADCSVQQLDRDGSVLKTYQMLCTWPTTIGQIELSNESTDTIEKFPVTFRYLTWRRSGLPTSAIPTIPF